MAVRWRNGTPPTSKWRVIFTRLRIRNRVLLGQLVMQVLDRAMKRAPNEPQRPATELAEEELDQLVTEWFATVLERIPTGVEQMLSARGRLALLLADMPGKWQDQFLRPGPWPEEFVSGDAGELTCVPARTSSFPKWPRARWTSGRSPR